MNIKFRNTSWSLLLACLLSLTSVLSSSPHTVSAQAASGSWATPVNLSRSGSANQPEAVAGSGGKVYVFWQDPFSGYQYSLGTGQKWSDPARLQLPSQPDAAPRKAVFLSDGKGKLFLIDTDTHFQLSFLYAAALTDGTLGQWYFNTSTFQNVVDFAAAVDQDGNIHLVYLLGQDTSGHPAGIYYAKLNQSGGVVSSSGLDISPYYRILVTTSQKAVLTNPNPAAMSVQALKQGAKETVFAAWNNPQANHLYSRISLDGGASFQPGDEVDPPDANSSNLSRDHPILAVAGTDTFQFWQANQNAVSCAQYYRFSPDAGKSWGQRQALFSDLGVCPDGIQLLTGADQQAVLVSVINHAVYFSKWTGQDFSPAAVDRDLSGFTDPLSFHPIQLGCQEAVAAGEEIYVIGCGTFGAGSDIWVTSRSMSSLFQAGEMSVVWSSPAVIASEQVRPDTISFSADPGSGLLRAFWSQPDSSLASQPGSSIYYAGWQAPKAVVPAAVLSSSSGKANQPSFALDNHGRMYVVWSGGKSGEINFSWAASDGGGVAADWFRPAVLPSPLPDAAQPQIQVDGGGALNVAFLIPLNEKRGVYFVRSTDRGASWSEPVQVFDGTAGGCDMLDQLSLVVTARGTLHASWVCSTIPGGLGPYAYRVARSADRGEKWAVLPDSANRSVIWSKLAAAAQGSLHRVWLENLNGRRIFYDQVSTDDGVGWNPAVEIASSDLPGGPADLAADPAGQLYLVQAAADGGKYMLSYWKWDGSAWAKGDGTVLADDPNSQVESLDSAVVPGGSLAVLYVLQAYDPVQKVKRFDLAYTNYPITIPPAVSLNAPAIPGTALAVQPAPSTASQPAGSPGASARSAPPSFSSVPKQSGRTAVTYGIGVGLTLALVLGVFILRRRGHES